MACYAIGDIHGCRHALERLLAKLTPSAEDHLIFIGDYIDRGPDSRGVIELLLDLRRYVPCTFLRGNHEAMMLEYLETGDLSLWSINGGLRTLESYQEPTGEVVIPESHIRFIRDTLLFYQTPDFFFVHAGLDPDRTIVEHLMRCSEHTFLWERRHLDAAHLAWEKPVVCGHTPQAEPVNRDKLICIDTGCVYYTYPDMGTLTAVRLPERRFIQVRPCP